MTSSDLPQAGVNHQAAIDNGELQVGFGTGLTFGIKTVSKDKTGTTVLEVLCFKERSGPTGFAISPMA